MDITDYVPTSFLFQLLYYFPNLIDHIRFNRYKWDSNSKLDNYSNNKDKDELEEILRKSISNSKYRKFSETWYYYEKWINMHKFLIFLAYSFLFMFN